ncbi:hypothetical protein CD30_12295 [Ureibacillus massiliensis 4400831 = CIP 108448 = CCUG 49529]|uniref:Uncharacterized protein n=1 Tax=Ureibacillus massiliensis 4400831 = CIP 108448 = CCUG 49529 TaxID=1211035 RepID=A0A0A3JTM5_9BACL|nr:hypothetical protein [Ureibacillus massiliensis]KGR90342.1 hypothetical protein CD30_12295 [Ureibacillus massiliensis 4400831 = CIP 108448 = CCUG 49529]
MRWFIYVVFFVLFLGVTFFGLGPVMFADGSNQERFIAFLIVLLIYVILTILLICMIKKSIRH